MHGDVEQRAFIAAYRRGDLLGGVLGSAVSPETDETPPT